MKELPERLHVRIRRLYLSRLWIIVCGNFFGFNALAENNKDREERHRLEFTDGASAETLKVELEVSEISDHLLLVAFKMNDVSKILALGEAIDLSLSVWSEDGLVCRSHWNLNEAKDEKEIWFTIRRNYIERSFIEISYEVKKFDVREVKKKKLPLTFLCRIEEHRGNALNSKYIFD